MTLRPHPFALSPDFLVRLLNLFARKDPHLVLSTNRHGRTQTVLPWLPEINRQLSAAVVLFDPPLRPHILLPVRFAQGLLKTVFCEGMVELPPGNYPHGSQFVRGKTESLMRKNVWLKIACTGAVVAAVFVSASFMSGPRVTAESNGDSRVQLGFAAAPVHLNMKGKNPALVGLGSYYVNVVGDCNGCHSAGPATEFLPTGNPYFNEPKIVNTDTYLGGGRDFGFLGPPTASAGAHIISRNLTPDASGLPEGGNTFDQFLTIIRTGVDPDHRHLTCAPGMINSGCVPAPFDGNLLQVMPWPTLQDLSDHDLRAIYEYLGAVPCIQGHDAYEPPNRCG